MRGKWSIPRWAQWRRRTAAEPRHTTSQRSGRAGNPTGCASTARGRAAYGKQCPGPNQWGGRKVSPGVSEVGSPSPSCQFLWEWRKRGARTRTSPWGLRSHPLAPGPPPCVTRPGTPGLMHPIGPGFPENRPAPRKIEAAAPPETGNRVQVVWGLFKLRLRVLSARSSSPTRAQLFPNSWTLVPVHAFSETHRTFPPDSPFYS